MIKTFEHFTFRELFRSCHAEEVKQCIDCGYLDSLIYLMEILDNFRDDSGISIIITSSYRSPDHNALVGGSSTSQHMCGTAIDFTSRFFDSLVIAFKAYLKKFPSHDIGQVIINHKKKYIHLALVNLKYKSLTITEL